MSVELETLKKCYTKMLECGNELLDDKCDYVKLNNCTKQYAN